MAVAILLAGIAQAAHYPKDALRGGTGEDVQCVLCLFGASAAGPPTIAHAVRALPPCRLESIRAASICPISHVPAPYQARGPPLV